MRSGGRLVAFITWGLMLGASGATACETFTGVAGTSPLYTRKPVEGDDARLTTGFGLRRHPLLMVTKMHTGVDWSAPTGTPVIAAAGGRVAFAGAKAEYGNVVFIDHGGGWRTGYAHLLGFDVREGDCVAPLTVIGKIGSTGLSSGPQLHFEVLHDGRYLDPMSVSRRDTVPSAESK
jgi:murein DD-endopeptidase MepM/ murein hydrolase activator NlpD